MIANEQKLAIWLGENNANAQEICPHCKNDEALAELGRLAHNAFWNKEGKLFDRSNGGIYATWVTTEKSLRDDSKNTEESDKRQTEPQWGLAAKFFAAANVNSLHIGPNRRFPDWKGEWTVAILDLTSVHKWWRQRDARQEVNPILALVRQWQQSNQAEHTNKRATPTNKHKKEDSTKQLTLKKNKAGNMKTMRLDGWQRLTMALDELLPNTRYELDSGTTISAESYKQRWQTNIATRPPGRGDATLIRPDGCREITAILEGILQRHLVGEWRSNKYIIRGNFAHAIPGIGTFGWELERFAEALLSAATLTSTQEATNQLRAWTQGQPARYTKYLVLTNLLLKEDDILTFEEGIEIRALPYHHRTLVQLGVPEIWIGHSDNEMRGPEQGVPDIWGATCLVLDMSRGPVLLTDKDIPFEQRTTSTHPLTRVWKEDNPAASLTGLSLACNTPVRIACEWEVVPDGTRAFCTWFEADSARRSRCKVHSPIQTRPGRDQMSPLSTRHLKEASLLAKSLASQGIGPKTQLAFTRWCSSMEGSKEDRAIDLRIALEALYASEGGGEVGYRVRTRCAKHLGKDYDDFQRIDRTLKKFYAAASKFVHANTSTKRKNNDQPSAKDAKDQEGIDAGSDLCRQGLIKIVNEGEGQDLDMGRLTYS